MKHPTRTALMAIMIATACQAQVSRHQGNGFAFNYPATWKKQVTEFTVALLTPEPENQIGFKFFVSGDSDFDTFFAHYRASVAAGNLGFAATLDENVKPTPYGFRAGNTIFGRGNANGVPVIVSATGIQANGQIYLLQMVSPQNRAGQAYGYRETLASSLVFGPAGPAPSMQSAQPTGRECWLCEILQSGDAASQELAGTWRFESASLSHYEEIILTLRSDGTYTKRFTWRSSMTVGGYTGTGPTGGGTHNGTWTATGRVVALSGDGNWPASTHDLSTFRRIE